MEQRVPGAPKDSEFLNEHREEGDGSYQLDDQRRPQNKCRQPHDPAHLGRCDGLLHRAALHQADPPPGQDRKGSSHRDNAKAADLDQQKDHKLPEVGPVGRGIVKDQPRHADGGSRGEQRVQEWGADPLL